MCQAWGVWSALKHSVWSLHFASLECNVTHIHLRLHKYVHIHTYIHTYVRTYVCMWQSGAWDYYVHVSCELVTILSYTEHLHFILEWDREPLTTASPPATHTRRQDISMYMLIWLARPSLASQTNLHVWAMNTQQGAILNMYPSHSMHTCHVAWEP